MHLVWRSTDLSNNRCGGSRHDPQLETSTMIGPDSTVAAVGGNQHAGVVDRGHALPAPPGGMAVTDYVAGRGPKIVRLID